MKTEQELRQRVTDFQNKLGMKDHGWCLGSEIAEIKQKIVVDKIGDWRKEHSKAYDLGRAIFLFEQAQGED